MEVTAERVYAIHLLMDEEEYEELDDELNFVYSVLSDRKLSYNGESPLMKVQKLLELKDKMTREIKG